MHARPVCCNLRAHLFYVRDEAQFVDFLFLFLGGGGGGWRQEVGKVDTCEVL